MSTWDFGYNVPRRKTPKTKKVRPLTDYSEEELREEIRKRTHTKLVHLVENIDEYIETAIKRDIESMILAVLGFRYSFGRWEVDGKESVLRTLIRDRCRALIKDGLDDCVEKWTPTQKTKKELQRAVKLDFEEAYNREVRNSVHDTLENRARELVAKDVDDFLLEMDAEQTKREEERKKSGREW